MCLVLEWDLYLINKLPKWKENRLWEGRNRFSRFSVRGCEPVSHVWLRVHRPRGYSGTLHLFAEPLSSVVVETQNLRVGEGLKSRTNIKGEEREGKEENCTLYWSRERVREGRRRRWVYGTTSLRLTSRRMSLTHASEISPVRWSSISLLRMCFLLIICSSSALLLFGYHFVHLTCPRVLDYVLTTFVLY